MQRQVWWPPRRSLRLRAYLGQTVFYPALGVIWLLDGDRLPALLALVGAMVAAMLAWDVARCRVVTDANGLRIVGPFRSRYLANEEVAELRPNARAPWADQLVVVTRDREVVDLHLAPTSDILSTWPDRNEPDV